MESGLQAKHPFTHGHPTTPLTALSKGPNWGSERKP
jgi:hypothetical protein